MRETIIRRKPYQIHPSISKKKRNKVNKETMLKAVGVRDRETERETEKVINKKLVQLPLYLKAIRKQKEEKKTMLKAVQLRKRL